MAKKTYRQAINEALRQEMERDPRVIIMGEDVAGGLGAPSGGIIPVRSLRTTFSQVAAVPSTFNGSIASSTSPPERARAL